MTADLGARLAELEARLLYLTSKNAPQLPDRNPFPRFRLWRWWPRARHS